MLKIRKKATLLLTLILLSVFSVPIVLVTADEPTGNTLLVPQQFPGAGGIAAAIAAALPGDRIEVSDGVYNWFVVPNFLVGLQIVAVEPNVYIAGPGPTGAGIGVVIIGDNTLFKGFHVANYAIGIWVFADDCIIEDNDIMENWWCGIRVFAGDDNTIRRNNVHDAGAVPAPGFQGIWVDGLPGIITSIPSDMSDDEVRDAVMVTEGVMADLYVHDPVNIKDTVTGTDVDYWLPDPEETEYRLPLSEEQIEERLGGDTLMSKFFCENNRVINNEVTGYFIGIHTGLFTSGSIVVKNWAHGNNFGIMVGPIARQAYVVNNLLTGNFAGIFVWFNVYEVVIKRNQVGNQGNTIGILVVYSFDVDILRNIVEGNVQGIVVFGWPFPFGPPTLWTVDIKIINNEVYNNDNNGIWMFGVYDFRVQRNHVYNNGWGVPPAPGASGIHVILCMNGRVGGRRWRARNTVHDQQGDGIAVRVSNEILVRKNEVYANGGNQLFWFHLAAGTALPTVPPGQWIEPGRVRFIKNKDDLGNLLVPVILGLP